MAERTRDDSRYKSIILPSGFIGDSFQVIPGSIEQTIMFTPRPSPQHFNLSLAKRNVIVIFQALHRTQQHRLLTHTVAEDVTAVLGHASLDGANAVARIVDYYCDTRLKFNRENRKRDEYDKRRLIHVLVDEEIRWRLTLGTDHPHILNPKISQTEAKRRYVEETKQLITSGFRNLMEISFPRGSNGPGIYRNKHFGILKGIDLKQDMSPMRAMEPRVRHEDLPKFRAKDYSLTTFFERYEAKKAAEASSKAPEDGNSGPAHEDADGAGPSSRPPKPPVNNANSSRAASEHSIASDDMDLSDGDDSDDDAQMSDPLVPHSASDSGDQIPYTEAEIQEAEYQKAAEDALAEERRQHLEKVAVLEAKIAGHKKAHEQLVRGLVEVREQREVVAQENLALRNERDAARQEAEATQQTVEWRDGLNNMLAVHNHRMGEQIAEKDEELARLRREGVCRMPIRDCTVAHNGRVVAYNDELQADLAAMERAHTAALREVDSLQNEKEEGVRAFQDEVELMQAERARQEREEMEEAAYTLIALSRHRG
ncbi:hypothetical protein PG994_005108 [Apiospora phragmitis]|uniref:Uncharacterized protein n=1 Tax=Apiospora phragmitis TaxID=2905665 RepID=A0ABR1VWC1_9PEZI